jgi:hypothetical protein
VRHHDRRIQRRLIERDRRVVVQTGLRINDDGTGERVSAHRLLLGLGPREEAHRRLLERALAVHAAL